MAVIRWLPSIYYSVYKDLKMNLAEREGFEPSIELLTLYSLSRGAPSASRASLRGMFLAVAAIVRARFASVRGREPVPHRRIAGRRSILTGRTSVKAQVELLPDESGLSGWPEPGVDSRLMRW